MKNTSHFHYRFIIMDLCIEYNRVVTGRQQSSECDHYHEWQHRICGTGISQQEYREAVRSREGLDWVCGPCLVDINGDSGEDDDTHIDQLGGYVVPPLIVEPDVYVNIPVIAQIVNNPPPIQYEG